MGVGNFLKTVGKVAYPFLSTAAIAGGPLTSMAAAQIGKALGIDKVEPTPEAIAAVMAKAAETPEQALALTQAENDFQITCKKLNIESIEKMQQIAADDRKDARAREIAVRDNTPRMLAYIFTIGFFVTLLVYIGIAVKGYVLNAATDKMLTILLTIMTTMMIGVKEYFFGSSMGSDRKTELLAGQSDDTPGK